MTLLPLNFVTELHFLDGFRLAASEDISHHCPNILGKRHADPGLWLHVGVLAALCFQWTRRYQTDTGIE
jgi:hypothetical protein